MPFPVDEGHIESAEAALGAAFPAAYRSRLRRENGGSVVLGEERWWLFPVFDTSSRKRVSRTANHVVRETAVARDWPGFPPDAVAIGENGSGDLLVLLGEPSGRALQATLFWWNHETEETRWTGAYAEALERSDDG